MLKTILIILSLFFFVAITLVLYAISAMKYIQRMNDELADDDDDLV